MGDAILSRIRHEIGSWDGVTVTPHRDGGMEFRLNYERPWLTREKAMSTSNPHDHTPTEERRIREAALDETIAGSFPASDPPSTLPNPDEHDAEGSGVESGVDEKDSAAKT